MSARRRARQIALQVLYSLESSPEADAAAAVSVYFERFDRAEAEDDPAAAVAGSDRPFTEQLVREVSRRRSALDDLVRQVSRNWRIERMALVDRTILRMALYELQSCDDIPGRVTLNEAIELAKRFGADDSPAFINGLLDSALRILHIDK